MWWSVSCLCSCHSSSCQNVAWAVWARIIHSISLSYEMWFMWCMDCWSIDLILRWCCEHVSAHSIATLKTRKNMNADMVVLCWNKGRWRAFTSHHTWNSVHAVVSCGVWCACGEHVCVCGVSAQRTHAQIYQSPSPSWTSWHPACLQRNHTWFVLVLSCLTTRLLRVPLRCLHL